MMDEATAHQGCFQCSWIFFSEEPHSSGLQSPSVSSMESQIVNFAKWVREIREGGEEGEKK